MDSTIRLLHILIIQNFKPLTICGCIARFVSDLFGNPKTGFLMTRLIYSTAYSEVRGSLDIFGLLFMGLELGIRMKWLGLRVQHKPGCTATENGYRLEILDLGSRGIVLSI